MLRDFDGIIITDAMSAAGAARLAELRQADVDLFYAAQEVFLAMLGSRPQMGPALNPALPNLAAHDISYER